MERIPMLDFSSVKNGSKTFAELAASLTKADLYRLTDEMVDTMQEIIADAVDADVVFVPDDPQANDAFGKPEEVHLPWTLGHIIVHTTASSEEAAALALVLARGLLIEGRSRYEVYWKTVTSVAQIRQRLEESRRMCKAMLNAWPDEPHLDVTFTHSRVGELNAIGRFLFGLSHNTDHLGQLREIMRQSRELHPRT
ncbi:DinB family protein [Ktedonobacter robiniae]|nr:DinB family protein [Ktedonobacter robiniae]